MANLCATREAVRRHWSEDCIFYHIYPLGLAGAAARNNYSDRPHAGFESLLPWLLHAKSLGMNAIYLGPIFESMSHGYDTVNYRQIDRRLGDNAAFRSFVTEAHRQGIRIVLDGVFGHVGRDFPAFQDLITHGRKSPYVDWFRGVDFSKDTRFQDGFSYEYWQNAVNLPRLNLGNPDVRSHLFAAIDAWISDFDIDGLRLDTADVLALDFLDALRRHCEGVRPDFWLMGEVVHGDYRTWTQEGRLHSVTNYDAYSDLSSAALGKDLRGVAGTLVRQFGEGGSHRDRALYNFLDNHDVDRIASKLGERSLLFPLHCLLFTMPGIPSIYYGSEWGLMAQKTAHSDTMLRPALDLKDMQKSQCSDLPESIARLARLRDQSEALRHGDYTQWDLGPNHLVFLRQAGEDMVLVALNFGAAPVDISPSLKAPFASELVDLLNPWESMDAPGPCRRIVVPPRWARVLKLSTDQG
jgi:cyclomaltodextrinase